MKTELNINYLKDERWHRMLFYIMDTLLVSLLYLFLGLGVSTFINKRICQELDTSKDKFTLFLETTWESFLIIFAVFVIIIFMERLPVMIPHYDKEHALFRRRAGDIILAFAIVFGHEKLLYKYDYLLGNI